VLVVLVTDDQQEEVEVSWRHVPSGVLVALQPAERLLCALGVNLVGNIAGATRVRARMAGAEGEERSTRGLVRR
jgi:hypothetical protein